ncbi:MAG: hypothetical protein ACXW3P_09080, partial [Rhodospirillales bacterium]
TGTSLLNVITPDEVSPAVTAEPAGSVPSPAADTIIGLGGNDDIDGGGGADTISGGTGNDTITAAASGGTVHGDAGSDTITIRQTTDDVAGTFYGDADNDSMTFSTWSDSANRPVGTLAMHGGAGADRMTGTATISDDVTGLTINKYGEDGDDRLEALRVFTFSNAYPYEEGGNDNLYGGPGNDT